MTGFAGSNKTYVAQRFNLLREADYTLTFWARTKWSPLQKPATLQVLRKEDRSIDREGGRA